jgi:hypothetical protein
MSVGFYITFIGLLTRRYIEQTPDFFKRENKRGAGLPITCPGRSPRPLQHVLAAVLWTISTEDIAIAFRLWSEGSH